MSIKVIDDVWKYSKSKGSPLLLLLAIADNANEETREAHPGIQYLANKIRMSERAVRYCLRELEKMSELSTVINGFEGKSNLYKIATYPHIHRQSLPLGQNPTVGGAKSRIKWGNRLPPERINRHRTMVDKSTTAKTPNSQQLSAHLAKLKTATKK